MSVKQETQETLAPTKPSLVLTFPDDNGKKYLVDASQLVVWQAPAAFTVEQNQGPNIFNLPVSSSTTAPYQAQANAQQTMNITCYYGPNTGERSRSAVLTGGNVIIVDTSTPGPPANLDKKY